MRHRIYTSVWLLLLAAAGMAQSFAGQTITSKERQDALDYLDRTRDGVQQAVSGLSEEQWKFKPGPDRWSVAEVVEHLALIENAVNGIVDHLSTAPAPAANRNTKEMDAMLLARVPDRTTKVKAPEIAVPTGRWEPSEALQHFLTSRKQTASQLQNTPDLRAHVVNHPALGPLDGYQWVLTVAAHTERHTKQILEVKADPNFPAK